jgi:hypothetical protein
VNPGQEQAGGNITVGLIGLVGGVLVGVAVLLNLPTDLAATANSSNVRESMYFQVTCNFHLADLQNCILARHYEFCARFCYHQTLFHPNSKTWICLLQNVKA